MASMLLSRNVLGDRWFLMSESLGQSAQRYCWAVLTGLAVTTSLFFLIQYLIAGADAELAEPTRAATLQILPELEDLEIAIKDPRPKPPTPPEVKPKSVLEMPVSLFGGRDEIGPKTKLPPPQHKVDIRASDGGILPIVTVAPTYPRRMAARGIEGWVLLGFSVDQLGRVQNPQVIDAQPANGFNRAAIDAVSRYKYKPKVFDGKAVWVHGVQTRMTFQLNAD